MYGGCMTIVADGYIDRVIAKGGDGWCVLVVKKRGRAAFRCVGTMLDARVNAYIRVHGEEITHPKFGKQIKAATIEEVPPPDELGMRRFLESVTSIGPELAKIIVDKFGSESLDILRFSPDRLTEVDGIGPKRATQLSKFFCEWDDRQEELRQLLDLGLTAKRAAQVRKTWKNEAVARIRRNPYSLLELDGFGFKTVDEIAQVMGIGEADPRRVAAGLNYSIEQAMLTRGHCWMDPDEFITAMISTIGCDYESAEDAVANELDRNALETAFACVETKKGLRLSASKYWRGEKRIKDRFLALADSEGCGYDVDAVYRELDISPSKGQRHAIEAVSDSSLTVITGGPGTGKSTIAKALATAATRDGKSVALCAPTGRAAIRLTELTGFPAYTIHRLLGVYFSEKLGKWRFSCNANRRMLADFIIVDEFSMVDTWLAERLLSAVDDGAAVVIIGDADQLPSVGPGAVLRDVVDSNVVKTIWLRTIHRQAMESPIIVAAHTINNATKGNEALARLVELDSQRFKLKLCSFAQPINDQYNYVHETLIQQLKRYQSLGYDLQRDVQILAPMKKGEIGVFKLNDIVREFVNPVDRYARLRNLGAFVPGDRVIHIKNNYNLRVFNGEVGIVEKADSDYVTVLYSKRHITYDISNIKQLMQAFAITIHKSQGSEFPAVIVIMHSAHSIMLRRQLIYTAVTRAQEHCTIIGNGKGVMLAIDRTERDTRNTSLKELLRGTLSEEDVANWGIDDYVYPDDEIEEREDELGTATEFDARRRASRS